MIVGVLIINFANNNITFLHITALYFLLFLKIFKDIEYLRIVFIEGTVVMSVSVGFVQSSVACQ